MRNYLFYFVTCFASGVLIVFNLSREGLRQQHTDVHVDKKLNMRLIFQLNLLYVSGRDTLTIIPVAVLCFWWLLFPAFPPQGTMRLPVPDVGSDYRWGERLAGGRGVILAELQPMMKELH